MDRSIRRPINRSDIEVLTRQGESPSVLEKKILLSILATREASRLGIPITEADIQSVSDSFRKRFDLQEPEKMSQWLDEVGLDLKDYLHVMQGFAAVFQLQADCRSEIESLMLAHAKVSSIRNRDR